MDPLEKEHWRQKIATRMGVFIEAAPTVSCVSAHVYDEPHLCELCQEVHAQEIFVVKNRSGKKLLVAVDCLKEMVRFKVTDVDELSKWLGKLPELRAEEKRRKAERAEQRLEEVKRLERKVIVRKRATEQL